MVSLSSNIIRGHFVTSWRLASASSFVVREEEEDEEHRGAEEKRGEERVTSRQTTVLKLIARESRGHFIVNCNLTFSSGHTVDVLGP